MQEHPAQQSKSAKVSMYKNEPPQAPPPMDDTPIVVVRPPLSARERSFIMAGKVLRMTLRIIAYLIVFLLSSVGMTALVNEGLRAQLLEPFMPYIGDFLGGM